jgi:hypothetical protein
VIGVAVAAWRVRQTRYALLLVWLFVTLTFAGALLLDAPDSHRLLIAVPAVVVLTTTGLFWLARRLIEVASALSGNPAPVRTTLGLAPHELGVLVLMLLFVAGGLFFYFGEYRLSHRFGDRNSEVAYEMGRYLDSLQGDWQAYFYGPPAMYVTFPTILYLAPEFQAGVNLFDVTENLTALPDPPSGANLVFVYLPERSAEVNETSERFPQGDFLTFDGILANPLFYAYEVRR